MFAALVELRALFLASTINIKKKGPTFVSPAGRIFLVPRQSLNRELVGQAFMTFLSLAT